MIENLSNTGLGRRYMSSVNEFGADANSGSKSTPSGDIPRAQSLHRAVPGTNFSIHPLFDTGSLYCKCKQGTDGTLITLRDAIGATHETLSNDLFRSGYTDQLFPRSNDHSDLNSEMEQFYRTRRNDTGVETNRTWNPIHCDRGQLPKDAVMFASTDHDGNVQTAAITNSRDNSIITGILPDAHPVVAAINNKSAVLGPTSNEFKVFIPLDSINIGGQVRVKEGQKLRLLLLNEATLNHLKALLEQKSESSYAGVVTDFEQDKEADRFYTPSKPVESREDAAKVIAEVMKELQLGEETKIKDPMKHRYQFWLSAGLLNSPSLEGVVSQSSTGLEFSSTIPLKDELATLKSPEEARLYKAQGIKMSGLYPFVVLGPILSE